MVYEQTEKRIFIFFRILLLLLLNTNKTTATDMITLVDYVEATDSNGMTNERIQSLPVSELDHLLSNFFSEHVQEKWRRVRASLTTFSSFQCTIQRYLLRNDPFNILKDKEFEKSRRVLAAKRKSPVHKHSKGTEQAIKAIDENKDALF